MTLELFRMKYKEIQQTRKLKAVMLSTTPAANYLSISDLCAVAGVGGRWINGYVIVLQYITFAVRHVRINYTGGKRDRLIKLSRK